MYSRRDFLKHAVASAGAAVSASTRSLTATRGQSARLERLGVGLFTIPTLLERDFAGSMRTIAQIGYKEVETFGPYPFSAQSAQDRWKAVSQSLNFKGSGYF